MASKIVLEQMEIGPMQNFIYFFGDAVTREVALIDPGWEAHTIIDQARHHNVRIIKVLLTHGHPDHVNALPEFLRHCPVPVYLSKDEIPLFRPSVDLQDLCDGDRIGIGSVQVTCLASPGHSPGGMCFLSDSYVITGDTLFVDACGRVDLPGGDGPTLMRSIQRLCSLPDTTMIYPGHNYGPKPYDTIENQKKTNPYMGRNVT